ncbi:class III lanthionine synthetase LanKC [Nocardia sp. NPDC051900]|uniref:class III lanthionine synthetase LanKC n=1 Tax=Nocardia sp. NPDC051900 TaxID=3364326 RepID=UPI00378EF62B
MRNRSHLQNIEIYCADQDPVHYSNPGVEDAEIEFSAEVGQDWDVVHSASWTYCNPPPGRTLPPPEQGWKIHISSVPAHCEEVLRIVSRYCCTHGLYFKYLRGRLAFSRANTKYAARSASGKFITIYPHSSSLQATLEDLEARLREYDGPYVLSDIRWRTAPVFLRYGGFAPRTSLIDGRMVPSIVDLDGESVPDERLPYFVPPAESRIPEFLRRSIRDRSDSGGEPLPFVVDRALHFSNCGGVYVALRESDRFEVVLKEARPYVAFDVNGEDAISRLENEYKTLRSLSTVAGVVRASRLFSVAGHRYMEMDYVRGTSLYKWVAGNYPYSEVVSADDYATRAKAICEQLVHIVLGVHTAGVSINDLQPRNIIIGADHSVTLIDLELARPLGERNIRTMGTPGFMPRMRCARVQQDRYALMRTIIHVFSPLTPLPSITDEMWLRQRTYIAKEFGAAVLDWIEELDDELGGPVRMSVAHDQLFSAVSTPDESPSVEHLEASLIEGIRKSANVKRDAARIYPGSPDQYLENGGVNIATGSLGVELMVSRHARTGVGPVRVSREAVSGSLASSDYSLLSGRVGMACALHEMARFPDLVDDLLDGVEIAFDSSDVGLGAGLAGIVLGLHSMEGSGLDRLKTLTSEAVEHLAVSSERALESAAPRPGLLDGLAGAAIALAYVTKGAAGAKRDHGGLTARLLDAAVEQLAEAPDGSLQVREHGNLYPYLGSGSAGVALAIAMCQSSGIACKESFVSVLAKIRRACAVRTCLYPGLFDGMAGLVLAERHIAVSEGRFPERPSPAKLQIFTFLSPHGGAMTSGYGSRRLVADYSTGSAGILPALTEDLSSQSWLPVAYPNRL